LGESRAAAFLHKNKSILLADLSLALVALAWGANFVVMKDALVHITPFAYLGVRFLLATLILAAASLRPLGKAGRDELKCGLLAGVLLFSGFAVQTVGLTLTTPAKSGFITGTSVVIVPFFYFLATGKHPGRGAFAGGFLALAGLFFFTLNGGSLQEVFLLQYGDFLTLLCAFFFAGHIVALGIVSPCRNTLVLSVLQLAVVGLLSLVTALIFEGPASLVVTSPALWAAILYAIVFCTIGAFVTQTAAQKHTPAAHASLILSTEAIFAGVFSFFFWGESFTPPMIAGIFFILAGIFVTILRPGLRGIPRLLSRSP
jgi:drug/metabolite transporter (DMT)-like permease